MKHTRLFRPIASLFAAALMVAGCADEDPVHYVNSGSVCVTTPTRSGERVAGDELMAVVTFERCVGCGRTEASCEVRVEGDVLVVESRGTYFPESGECLAICGAWQTTCPIGPLDGAGEYVVRHGGDEATLELPSPAPPCTGFEHDTT